MNGQNNTQRQFFLDEVDARIVSLLAADARMSARAIARRIGMSPGAVSERISRLEQRGVIVGYHVTIDPTVLGYRVHAVVGLETMQGPQLEDIIGSLVAIPEVASVTVVTGKWDLLVDLWLRDNDHLLDVVTKKVYQIKGFRRCETLIKLTVQSRSGGWLPPELIAATEEMRVRAGKRGSPEEQANGDPPIPRQVRTLRNRGH